MKVLLINPPYGAEERYGKDLGRFGPLNEPLGLAYIAASLERAGHEVAILDAPALGVAPSEIPSHMAGKGYGIVGVTMLTPMYARSVEAVRIVRGAYPNVTIVVGGAHPTILPRETLIENPEIDFAVMGEGEGVMPALARALEESQATTEIPGIACREGGEIRINPVAIPIPDLDDLPLPARHLLPMEAYQMTRSRSRASHAYTVSVARGCPFDCGFCCRIFGRKVRHHSAARILKEIHVLVDRYGAKEINLEADTITLNHSFLLSLCEGLLQSGLSRRIIWTCESRVDTVDFPLLKKMKEAGCWQISYGVETGTQRLLDIIQKGITLAQIEKTFAITKKVGIGIRAFYMLGLPTETREESLRTIAFAKKLNAGWSQFTLFTPFPGTVLHDLAVQEGGLRSRNWSDFKTHGGWTSGGLAYVPRGRTLNEMKSLQRRAYRAVYLRPRVFLRFLRNADSIGKWKVYGTGLFVLLKSARPGDGGRRVRTVRVGRKTLRALAQGAYVDSPVYFARNPLVRSIQWSKLDAALSLAPPNPALRVLDLCCGNGVLLPTLDQRYKNAVALDLRIEAAAGLRQHLRLGTALLQADGKWLPFRSGSFDLVFALSALEHFRNLDEVLSELHRILSPEGLLIFLSPTENLFYRVGRRVLGYTKPEDHHHTAEEVERRLGVLFGKDLVRNWPFSTVPFFSMFRVARFRKQF
jgi:anaerobic magnesium-protoporphyrin IX monomethyl ester cyclase